MEVLSVSIVIIILLVCGLLLALRFADGPLGPIPGGVLRKGTLVADEKIDWSAVINTEGIQIVELQLEQSRTSRLVGVFLYQGELYAACDLGFVGRRAPGILIGLIQAIVLSLKNWHNNALADGRVVIRIREKLYQRHATRVKDKALISKFKSIATKEGIKFFGYLEPEEEQPGQIWFFHLDRREELPK